jgi:hypothetical protein
LGLCAVNEQGCARKSVYPSGNRQGDAKKSRCSQQPNRSLRCLTNRACARSVAAQSHNTPEEITSCSRRKWIAAIASTHDLSDGNPETVALHRPHRGSVAVGTSHSRRMQSSGPTSRDLRHDNSFRIAAIDLDQGIVVTGLPTLFHGGTGELKALGRRLISARLVLQLHEGGNSDARFLLQELHLRALFEDVGQSPSNGCRTTAAATLPATPAASLATLGLNRERRPSKVRKATEWLRPSSERSNATTPASARRPMLKSVMRQLPSWITHYNEVHAHKALGYLSPR